MINRLLLFCWISLFLASCGTVRNVERASEETSDREDSKEVGQVIEDGVASWYGPNFHGKLTANGETYDMDGMTAAHRTLPFETVVRVENKENGKTVDVRINDRGPFAKDRIIDLSRAAAEEIDMKDNGTAKVEITLLEGDLKNSRTTDLKVATYTVQLGSYRSQAEAEVLSRKIEGSRVEKITANDDSVYRVYYEIYTDSKEAEAKQQELKDQGFNGFVKQIENN